MTPAEPCKFRTPISRSHLHGASVKAIFQRGLAEEKGELKVNYNAEHRELAGIYASRGLDRALAGQVASKLMEHDALGAHARDELGISEIATAKPLQAAVASACRFSIGAALRWALLPYLHPLMSCHSSVAVRSFPLHY